MKIASKYKFFIYYLPVLLAIVAALDIFPIVKVSDKFSSLFSAERVSDDIKYISKQPHSIQHPKEREVVRNYLFHRLEQMGAKTQIYEYDSIQCKFGGSFDIANVYAEFNPDNFTDTTQYVLLVAHLDSRFFNVVLKDTVYSYGAADDGYGLGVILELVGQAIKYRNDWKQGVKVLFTDSEEHELDGMANAVKNDSYLLKNVNLVINIEARGVKGAALLFETSPDNKAIMDLYSYAKHPRGFSFTTLVYKAMPNDTDFTLLKDSIPGMNFAVIDNLHYYHTDLDNFSNISMESLQHYGAQLEPVMKQYLTSDKYSCAKSLKSSQDNVFFAFPVLGMFSFTNWQYVILNIVVYIIFFIVLLFFIQLKGLKFTGILKGGIYALLFAVGALCIGEVVAYICALQAGLDFNIVAVKYVKCDNIIVLCSVFVLIISILIFMRLKMKKYKYFVFEFILGTLLLLFLISFIMFVTVFENFFVLIPLFVCEVALLLSLVKYGKFFIIISGAIITLISVYFLYLLYIAVTIGALGIILMFGALYIIIILSQYYYYKAS